MERDRGDWSRKIGVPLLGDRPLGACGGVEVVVAAGGVTAGGGRALEDSQPTDTSLFCVFSWAFSAGATETLPLQSLG